MPVPTTTGGSVPLKVVATISFGAGPAQIQRFKERAGAGLALRRFVEAVEEGALLGEDEARAFCLHPFPFTLLTF